MICYGSAFAKATRGVPLELFSIRGPAAAKVNLWKHWGGKSLCCGHIDASKSAVCSASGVAIGLWKHRKLRKASCRPGRWASFDSVEVAIGAARQKLSLMLKPKLLPKLEDRANWDPPRYVITVTCVTEVSFNHINRPCPTVAVVYFWWTNERTKELSPALFTREWWGKQLIVVWRPAYSTS